MEKFFIPGANLPELNLYVCKNDTEMQDCIKRGVPAFKWDGPMQDLWTYLLLPVIRRKFPELVLPERNRKSKDFCFVAVPGSPDVTEKAKANGGGSHRAAVADSRRMIYADGNEGLNRIDIDDYLPDLDNYVDINVLMDLKLLPKFLGDVATCIRSNLTGQIFREGYNKKLRVPVGNCNGGEEEKNLLIVDVSNSMGLIGTLMLRLLDSLRGWCSADLIITGASSYFYPLGSALPTPYDLRQKIGMGNESEMFKAILKTEVWGKQYANVISFGDNDCPYLENSISDNIKVRHVWHYFNRKRRHSKTDDLVTGYAAWTSNCHPQPEFHYIKEAWSNFVMKE